MDQLSIFEKYQNIDQIPPELVDYFPDAFSPEESSTLLSSLIKNIAWEQKTIKMYGKELNMPRLMAWYGDAGKAYSFSGTTYTPKAWTTELISIQQRINNITGVKFNSVLLNYYRNGNDSMGWHSDDEAELGINPIIASVSFGQARRFDIRKKSDHKNKLAIELRHGSLLVMKGDMQHHWEHNIAKSKKVLNERINLTFRLIK